MPQSVQCDIMRSGRLPCGVWHRQYVHNPRNTEPTIRSRRSAAHSLRSFRVVVDGRPIRGSG
eukprot:7382538-Prymnesium_polylepis.1